MKQYGLDFDDKSNPLSDAALLKELGGPESDDELDKDLKDLLNKAKKNKIILTQMMIMLC